MKRKFLIPLFSILIIAIFTTLALAHLFTPNSTEANNINQNISSSSNIITYTSVSEEEVIKALAYTYNDKELIKLINENTTALANGKSLNNFGSAEYSDYTDEQFGGMYVDKDRNTLYICYTEGELYNKIKKLNEDKSKKLNISANEKIGLNIEIKTVSNSYAKLVACRELLSNLILENKDEFSDVRGFGTNIIENKLRITLFETETYKETQEKLISILGKDIIIFEIVSPEDKVSFKALNTMTVSNDSEISNLDYSTSVGGIMYNEARNDNLLITCGHGYSANDGVYLVDRSNASQPSAYEIGTVLMREFTETTDFSVIEFNSNSTYSSNPVNELYSLTPVVGDTMYINGFVSGKKSGKILEVDAKEWLDDIYCSDMVKIGQTSSWGDSGGGAFCKQIDMGKTNAICALIRGGDNTYTYLTKTKDIMRRIYELP